MAKYIVTILLFLSLPLGAQGENDPASAAPVSEVQAEQNPAAPLATKFVSDELTIMLRAGPGTQYKILRALNTGTKLDVFESKDKYDRVQTHSGLQGWVLSQHLTDRPLAKHLLAQANEQLSQSRNKNKELQGQLAQLKENYNRLKETNRNLDKSNTELEEELTHIRSIAAQPIKLSDEKKQLAMQTEDLHSQVDRLQSELHGLRDDTHKQWFLTGAAVVLIGMLIGLTLPKLRRNRRTDWG